jgi:hypothetical protein
MNLTQVGLWAGDVLQHIPHRHHVEEAVRIRGVHKCPVKYLQTRLLSGKSHGGVDGLDTV